MVERFDFTWARLRDTEVSMYDGSGSTVGEV